MCVRQPTASEMLNTAPLHLAAPHARIALRKMVVMDPFWPALLLTVIAGLATSIGAGIGVMGRANSPRTLALGLGFSAGVMLYVSLFELLPEGQAALVSEFGEHSGGWVMLGAFLGGIAVVAVIDRMVPEAVNPHEPASGDAVPQAYRHALLRTGLFTAGALALHNFPEGFATLIAGLQQPEIALPVAVAIAIHNIPEGLAVAVPIVQATGSRARAFWWASLSGVAEPVGAVVGYLLLRPYLSDALMGSMFAAIAGVMVFVSLDELLPTAEKYGEHHLAIYGLVGGMGVMGASLVLMG